MSPLWSRMKIKRNYSHDIHNLHDSLSFIPCIMMFLLLLYDIHFLYLFLSFFITQVHYQKCGLHSPAYSSFTYTRIISLVRVIHEMDISFLSLPVFFTFNMLYSHISCPYFTWLRHTCIHNHSPSFTMRCTCALPFILVSFPFIL